MCTKQSQQMSCKTGLTALDLKAVPYPSVARITQTIWHNVQSTEATIEERVFMTAVNKHIHIYRKMRNFEARSSRPLASKSVLTSVLVSLFIWCQHCLILSSEAIRNPGRNPVQWLHWHKNAAGVVCMNSPEAFLVFFEEPCALH